MLCKLKETIDARWVEKCLEIINGYIDAKKLVYAVEFDDGSTNSRILFFDRQIADKKIEIDLAVMAERNAAANLAWEMQMESFGGGTAIGNAIQDGQRARRR